MTDVDSGMLSESESTQPAHLGGLVRLFAIPVLTLATTRQNSQLACTVMGHQEKRQFTTFLLANHQDNYIYSPRHVLTYTEGL